MPGDRAARLFQSLANPHTAFPVNDIPTPPYPDWQVFFQVTKVYMVLENRTEGEKRTEAKENKTKPDLEIIFKLFPPQTLPSSNSSLPLFSCLFLYIIVCPTGIKLLVCTGGIKVRLHVGWNINLNYTSVNLESGIVSQGLPKHLISNESSFITSRKAKCIIYQQLSVNIPL